MNKESWEKHLPQWALDYGNSETNWPFYLSREHGEVESLEIPACAFGVSINIITMTLFFEEIDGIEKIVMLGVAAIGGLVSLGWVNSWTSISGKVKFKEIAAKYAARKKTYSEKELKEVKLYRDWLTERFKAQEIEISETGLGVFREMRLKRLRDYNESDELRFLEVFLNEENSH
ncbi:MAG: hypothetical protein QNK83_08895 [Akkermansiaceae bacterium]